MTQHTTHRQFIQKAGTWACGAAVFTQPTFAFAQGNAVKQTKQDAIEEVSPVEDRMCEHGILERILGLNDLASFTSKLD